MIEVKGKIKDFLVQDLNSKLELGLDENTKIISVQDSSFGNLIWVIGDFKYKEKMIGSNIHIVDLLSCNNLKLIESGDFYKITGKIKNYEKIQFTIHQNLNRKKIFN